MPFHGDLSQFYYLNEAFKLDFIFVPRKSSDFFSLLQWKSYLIDYLKKIKQTQQNKIVEFLGLTQ